MAVFALTGARVFAGALDAYNSSNSGSLSTEREALDSTVFNNTGARSYVGGLGSSAASFKGFWDAGDSAKPDDRLWTDLSGTAHAFTVGPVGANVGDLAYVMKAFQSKYKVGGDAGPLLPYEAEIQGNSSLARGAFLHPPGTVRTTTANGTSNQNGALATGSTLVAALHVLSIAGTAVPTITVKVQSDNATGFPSSTDVLTFDAVTAVGSQVKTVAGPITDDWWRAQWTISGTNPQFTFVVAIGFSTP